MSDAYNPESKDFEKLQILEIEARKLAQKRDQAPTDSDQQIIAQQLEEIENQVTFLKNKLKP